MARGTSATHHLRTQTVHLRDGQSREVAVPTAEQATPIASEQSMPTTSRSQRKPSNVHSKPLVANKPTKNTHFCAQNDARNPECIQPHITLLDGSEKHLPWKVEDFHCASRLIAILRRCGIAVLNEALCDMSRISSILLKSSKAVMQKALELEQSDAVLFLNLLTMVLNQLKQSMPSSEFRIPPSRTHISPSEFRIWMAELAFKAGQLPSAIFVDGVELSSSSIIVGGGAQADIFRAKYQQREVALKALRIFETTLEADLQYIQKAFCKEAMLWWKLDHRNLLPVFGVSRVLLSQYPHRLALVTPWMPLGNLKNYISEYPTINRLKLLFHAAAAVKYLHDEHIVHGDIKAANILVNNSHHPQLADMGSSDPSASQSMVLASGCSGSQNWMAPELFGYNTRNTRASDVFAFGMTCFEVLTGKEPFKGLNAPAVQISKGERPLRPSGDSPQPIDDTVWDLLQSMWKEEPSERCSMNEVLSKLEQYSGLLHGPAEISTDVTLEAEAEQQPAPPSASHDVVAPLDSLHLHDMVKKPLVNTRSPKTVGRRFRAFMLRSSANPA